MAQQTHEVRDELSELKEDLGKVRGDLADLARAIIDVGKDQAAAAGHKVSKTASERWEQLQDMAQSLSKRGGKVWESVQDQAREHVGTSVLTAFGIGFVLGKLLDRRSGRS